MFIFNKSEFKENYLALTSLTIPLNIPSFLVCLLLIMHSHNLLCLNLTCWSLVLKIIFLNVSLLKPSHILPSPHQLISFLGKAILTSMLTLTDKQYAPVSATVAAAADRQYLNPNEFGLKLFSFSMLPSDDDATWCLADIFHLFVTKILYDLEDQSPAFLATFEWFFESFRNFVLTRGNVETLTHTSSSDCMKKTTKHKSTTVENCYDELNRCQRSCISSSPRANSREYYFFDIFAIANIQKPTRNNRVKTWRVRRIESKLYSSRKL